MPSAESKFFSNWSSLVYKTVSCNPVCHISIANYDCFLLLTTSVEWLKILIFMSFDSWTMGKTFQNRRIWVQMLTSSWLFSWPTIGLFYIFLWLSFNELVWQEDDFFVVIILFVSILSSFKNLNINHYRMLWLKLLYSHLVSLSVFHFHVRNE